MSMVEFKDKNGQPLSLRTNLENVDMEVTPPHDLELAAWDKVKPDLGTMSLPRIVVEEPEEPGM